MSLNKFTHKDYTMNGNTYQLKLPLNIEYLIPKDESVQLLGQIIEEMDLQKLYQSYFRHGKNQETPKQMFKILCYAYMNRIYSARGIERACKRDIKFMYLLEGKHAPDHATIACFRSLHVTPLTKELSRKRSEDLERITGEEGKLLRMNRSIKSEGAFGGS